LPDDESFLNDSGSVKRARELAGMAHEGELRRIRKEPFITHPVGVARIASEYDSSDFIQITSLLHDIIDHPIAHDRLPMADVREEFGFDVMVGIRSLSKTIRPVSLQEARLGYLLQTREETDPQIQLIRSADKIHNLESAIEEVQLVKKAFWRHFKGGKTAYLKWPSDVYDAIYDSGAISGHEILARYEETMQRFYETVKDVAS
jgi:(p)ppGpp synthase/HD superfamily hydrolase